MPLHRGHEFLLRFGSSYVDKLTIVVETQPNDPIPGEFRVQWVKEVMPDAEVLKLNRQMPQDPSES